MAKIYNIDDYKKIWRTVIAECQECKCEFISIQPITIRQNFECPACGKMKSVVKRII